MALWDFNSPPLQHKKKDFLERALQGAMGYPTARISNPKSHSTHKMYWGEDEKGYYVFPSIVNRSGKLEELSPEEADTYAHQTGGLQRFDTQVEAKLFAGGSWKKNPQLIRYLLASPNGMDFLLKQIRGF